MKKYIISETELDAISETRGIVKSVYILLSTDSNEETLLDWALDNLETVIDEARLNEFIGAGNHITEEIETRLSDIEKQLEAIKKR